MSQRRAFETTGAELERQARIWCSEPGFYAVRMTKGAVEVGMKIVHEPTRDPETGELLDRSWWWRYWVNGEEKGEPSVMKPAEIDRGGRYTGRPIDEIEYRFLLRHREWAAEHAKDRPEANPRQPVDFNTLPLNFRFDP